MKRFALVVLVLLGAQVFGFTSRAQSGTTGTYDSWRITVTGIEQRAEIASKFGGETHRARGMFQVIFFDATNTATAASRFPFEDITLTDTQNRAFTFFQDGTVKLRVGELGEDGGDLQPDLTYRTAIVFDVPEDAIPATLGSKDGSLALDLAATKNSTPTATTVPTTVPATATSTPARLPTTGPANDQTATPGAVPIADAASASDDSAALKVTVSALLTRVAGLEADATAQAAAVSTVIANQAQALVILQDRIVVLERTLNTAPSVASTPVVTSTGRSIRGAIQLTDRDANYVTGRACLGKRGYGDIRPGADVVVMDGAGAILAIGRLEPGVVMSGGVTCRLEFVVENVPDVDFYTLEVANRQAPSYSRAEMEAQDWTVELSIGD